jgi:hypothetical protein
MNVEGGWNLIFIYCSMETDHEQLDLKTTDVWHSKNHEHKRFTWRIILFGGIFKYVDGAKFRGYVVTNAERLCVEFCNFVQCYIFVNCLTC